MLKKIVFLKLALTLALLPSLAYGAGVTAAKGKTVNLSVSGGGGGTGDITGTGAGPQVAYFNATKNITSSSTLTFDGANLGVSGNVSAGGNVSAAGVSATANVTGSSGTFSGDVSAGRDSKAGRDVTAGRNVEAASNVNAGANVTGSSGTFSGDVSAGGKLKGAALRVEGSQAGAGSLGDINATAGLTLFTLRNPDSAQPVAFAFSTSTTLPIDLSLGVFEVFNADQGAFEINLRGLNGSKPRLKLNAAEKSARLQSDDNNASAGAVEVYESSAAVNVELKVSSDVAFSGIGPMVSQPSQGIIYYDSADNKLRGSENGGPAFDLGGQGPVIIAQSSGNVGNFSFVVSSSRTYDLNFNITVTSGTSATASVFFCTINGDVAAGQYFQSQQTYPNSRAINNPGSVQNISLFYHSGGTISTSDFSNGTLRINTNRPYGFGLIGHGTTASTESSTLDLESGFTGFYYKGPGPTFTVTCTGIAGYGWSWAYTLTELAGYF